MSFQLLFGANEEYFHPCSSKESTIPLLGLSHQLTSRFASLEGEKRPEPRRVFSTLQDIAISLKIPSWEEEAFVPTVYYKKNEKIPLLPEAVEYDEADWIWLEYLTLVAAAYAWLSPSIRDDRDRLIPPSVRFKEGWDRRDEDTLARGVYAAIGDSKLNLTIRDYRTAVLQYRLSQLHPWLDVREDKKGKEVYLRGYRSDSFFALLWAELLNAAEHDIYARRCENCRGLFALEPPYRKQTCSKKCAREWRAKNWPGGPEALREYNRQKKQESRGRLRRIKGR